LVSQVHHVINLRIPLCPPTLRNALRGVEHFWRALIKAPFDCYRPEQHYMRGPGPKYRAKACGFDERRAR
jgi:hypothetical protein